MVCSIVIRGRRKKLSTSPIPNDAPEFLRDRLKVPSQWHHLAIRRTVQNGYSSPEMTKDTLLAHARQDSIQFAVDGKSMLAGSPWGPLKTINQYGLPDCTGQNTVNYAVSDKMGDHHEGPSIEVYTNPMVGMGEYLPLDKMLPLASASNPLSGHGSNTFLKFDGIDIPAGAYVYSAKIEFCAAKNSVDWAGDLLCNRLGRDRNPLKMKVVGLHSTPDFQNAESACPISDALNAGRTSAEALWDLDMNDWYARAKPVVAQENVEDAQNDENCIVETADIASVVSELVGREEWQAGASINLVFANQEQNWGECRLTPWAAVLDGSGEQVQAADLNKDVLPVLMEAAGGSVCKWINGVGDLMDRQYAAWMVPFETVGGGVLIPIKGGSVAKLNIQYCLNKDCISPSFMGIGLKTHVGINTMPNAGGPEGYTESSPTRFQSPQDALLGADDTGGLRLGERTMVGVDLPGQIYGLSFTPRAMEVSEIQKEYYKGLRDLELFEGPEEVVENYDEQLSIEPFPLEVVSVIPPVLLQQRSNLERCNAQIPSLSKSMYGYLGMQTKKKCTGTYQCSPEGDWDFPAKDVSSGFTCVARDQQIDKSSLYYGRKSISYLGNEGFYPEFLDMMTVPIIYRDGKMRETASWTDLQTKEVVMLNVFMAPKIRAGTILIATWNYDGPGKMSGTYNLNSYVQMDKDTQDFWVLLNRIVCALSIIDLVLLLMVIFNRWQERKWYMHEQNDGGPVNQNAKGMIVKNTPLWEFWDLFDVGLRVVVLVFCNILHMHYYSSELDADAVEDRLGIFDKQTKAILNVPWDDKSLMYETKVAMFFDILIEFVNLLEADAEVRTFGYWVVIICFFRVVVYMRVHPRIAILYKTVEKGFGDLYHFIITFAMLYMVLAWLANWSFGDKMAEYGTLNMAIYKQFDMLLGGFSLPDTGFELLFGMYSVIYFFVVFSLLLNFFLAIVVDSYAEVKKSVDDSVIENAIHSDLWYTFTYPLYAIVYGWPNRNQIITRLLNFDADKDGVNDEEADAVIPVSPTVLVDAGICKNEKVATSLLKHYMKVCPALDAQWGGDDGVKLEHQKRLESLVNLDAIRARKGPAVKSFKRTASFAEKALAHHSSLHDKSQNLDDTGKSQPDDGGGAAFALQDEQKSVEDTMSILIKRIAMHQEAAGMHQEAASRLCEVLRRSDIDVEKRLSDVDSFVSTRLKAMTSQ